MGKNLILVIDDEKISLEITSGALVDAGYNVIKSVNPEEGIEQAVNLNPGLIILDWYMPNMDGLQVLNSLKKIKKTKEIPVIMATGIRTESEDLKHALDAGAVDFIRKPIDEIELLARVRSALSLVDYYQKNREHLKTIHKQEKQIIEQQTEVYQKELESKKHELVNSALQIVQLMDYTSEMVSKLKKFNLNTDENIPEELSSTIAQFHPDSLKQRWCEFEKQFEEVHTDFYKNLITDFPDLSSHERKLCVYFRMDMENKDIAALTFSTYEAVRKAKQRLKVKLRLTSNDNLTEFLNRY
jgi:DNA-binding response OmpR family regulator